MSENGAAARTSVAGAPITGSSGTGSSGTGAPGVETALDLARELFDNGSDALAIFDGSLRFLYWNAVLEILSGVPAPRALGTAAYELFPALSRSGVDGLFHGALAGRCARTRRAFFDPSAAGADSAFEFHFLPLHDDAGAVAGGVCVGRDRSGHGTVEQRLRETEQRFRTMADSAPVLLWMAGTDSQCWFFNQTWLSFTGRTMEQELGFGWSEGVHPEDFQTCVDTYMEAFNSRRPFEMVYRLRRHDGEYRWVLDHGTPRTTPDGEFAGFIGSCIDITDRKMAEDTARRTVERLARSNAELERFAFAASHDLQEPLRMVASYTELLARKYSDALDERGREYVQFAVEGAMRMKTLIDGLLAYSRVRHVDDSTFKPVELDTVVARALDNLRLSVEESGAAIECPPLPVVSGHELQLVQLFQNVLQNSIKFRSAVPPRVAISAERRGTEWQIAVRDNGIGMDMHHAEMAFVIFQRLNQRREYPGNGIGLALCKRIVELHRGRIWLDSAPGKGMAVFFTLPASER